MKIRRLASSLLLGLIFSFSFGAGYLKILKYPAPLDRLFALGVPALAFAILIHQWAGLRERLINSNFESKKDFLPSIRHFAARNRNGLLMAMGFFAIHLFLAYKFNHPALSYNTVLFESDAGPWLNILASPKGESINRAVHPLMLLSARPLIRLLSFVFAGGWKAAALVVVAGTAAACVFMVWLFIKRAAGNEKYAGLFAAVFGLSASQLVFGSLTDTYIFGTASLLLFLLLIQANDPKDALLIPAGVMVFGVTITNLAQSVIFMFFNKYGWKRIIRFAVMTIAVSVALTVFTGAIYPGRQTLFFVPQDIAVERTFVKPLDGPPAQAFLLKAQVMARTMFLYGVVGPEPLEVISNKKTDPYPTIDIKTFDVRSRKLAAYNGLGNIPLAAWVMFFAGTVTLFFKNIKTSPHLRLSLGLLGILAFNFTLHMNYGSELFLYTSYWVYALILFSALVYAEFAEKRWFQILLWIFVMILAANNSVFIFRILQAVAPFYASTPM